MSRAGLGGCCVFLLVWSLSLASSWAQPVLAVATETKIGTALPGGLAAGKIKISNPGTEPLVIHDLRSSCSCVMPFFKPPLRIAPGDTRWINVHMTTRREDRVSVRQEMIILSNDPLRESESVDVLVDIERAPFLHVAPSSLDLGHIKDVAAVSRRLALLVNYGYRLVLSDIEGPNECLRIAVRSTREDRQGRWLLVDLEFNPLKLGFGDFDAACHLSGEFVDILEKDAARVPLRQEIRVTGHNHVVDGAAVVSETRLSLGVRKAGATSVAVEIRAIDGATPVQVARATDSSERLSFGVSSGDNADMATTRVVITPNENQSGLIATNVLLGVSIADREVEVTIPYLAYLR